MTSVERVLPRPATVEVATVVAELRTAAPAAPLAEPSVAFVAALSDALLADPAGRAHPELASLGFFLRRAELATLAAEIAASAKQGRVRAPVGVVFHVPPANVDTIFAYSWLLSLLAGNRDVVRLSSRPSPVVDAVLGHAARLFAMPAHAAVASRAALIRYGHDDEINRALSAACDLRVLWGGDAAITALRRAPLPASARDLTFPDRDSLAVLAADAVLAVDGARLDAVASALANDIFWFDQAACSSPRTVCWIGSAEAVERAGARLYPAVAAAAARHGHQLEPAHVTNKELFAHRAVLDLPVTRRSQHGALMVLHLDGGAALPHDHPGAGLLWELRLDSMDELIPRIDRRHQSLGSFGIEAAELHRLVAALAGRGIDRVVPIGRALAFHRLWDGHDLMAELTRIVHIEAV